jgi:hypothetical protein
MSPTETLNDVVFACPPFDAPAARRLLERLKLYPLLTGTRSGEHCDIDSFCESAAAFSALVVALQPELREIDVNPLLVGNRVSICVDAHMSGALLPVVGTYTPTHEERRYDA